MGTEKIQLTDHLSVRIKEAAEEEVAEVRKARRKQSGPVPKGARVLSGSGPWYLYVDVEPTRFYAVYDASVATRLRRQSGWHILTTTGVQWRIKRLKAAEPRRFERGALEVALRSAVVQQMIVLGNLESTPEAAVEARIRRLVLISVNEDPEQPIDPADVQVLASVLGVNMSDLYMRSRSDAAGQLPWVVWCDDPSYPWDRCVVFAPEGKDAVAWIKAQWMFEHYESVCAGKTLVERLREYDTVIKAKIEATPAWIPGRVIAIGVDSSFQSWMDTMLDLKEAEGASKVLRSRSAK